MVKITTMIEIEIEDFELNMMERHNSQIEI